MTDLTTDVTDSPPEMVMEEESRWPTIVGGISLAYAIGGMTCQVAAGAGTWLQEWGMRMQGIEIEIPPILKLQAIAIASLNLVLGVYMLAGAIGLMRRTRAGAARLRRWALLRSITMIIGMLLVFGTMPAQLEVQRGIQEATNVKLRETGRGHLARDFDPVRQARIVSGATAGISLLMLAWPLFIGFRLTGRRSSREIASWT